MKKRHKSVLHKGLVVFLMMMVMWMSVGSAWSGVVFAEEGEEESGDEKIAGNIGIQGYDFVNEISSTFEYSEEVQLEITKAYLTGEPLSNKKTESVWTIKNDESGLSKYLLDAQQAETDEDFDKEKLDDLKILYMSPLYNKNQWFGESYVEFRELTSVAKLDITQHSSLSKTYTSNKSVNFQDLHNYSYYIDVFGTPKKINLNSTISEIITMHTMLNDQDNMSSNSVGKNFLSVDNYGNIVNNNLEIVIPYWLNDTIKEFREGAMFSGDQRFMSSPSLKDESALGAYKRALENSKHGFYEVEEFGLDQYYSEYSKKGSKKLIENTYASGFKNVYTNKVDEIAEFIVEKTKGDVEKFNKRYNKQLLKEMKDTNNVEFYISSTAGKDGSANSVESLDEGAEYIADAKGLMGKISRILDIGVFELIRLSWAAFIVHTYDSVVVNFSLSEIFNTSVLSDSQLWKNLTTTILMVLVSVMSVYLLLCLIRYMQGAMGPKEILIRFVILSVASISPIIGYSPLVDTIFNKPAEAVLGDEMEKMFLLDTWLAEREAVAEEVMDENSTLGLAINLRDRSEEYIIPFYTSYHVDGTNVNSNGGRDQNGDIPNEKQLVVVNVSAFHVFEWLEEGGEGETLFDYLATNYGSQYEGIENYNEEYKYDFSFSVGSDDYKGELVSASGLLEDVYEHMYDETYRSQSNIHLYNLGKELFIDGDYTGDEINQVIYDISLTGDQRAALYGEPDSVATGTSEVLKEVETLDVGETDMFALQNFVGELKGLWREGDSEVAKVTKDLNEKTIRGYVNNYLSLKDDVSDWSGYEEAEMNILILQLYFNIVNEMDIPVFSSDVEVGSISLDTYIRSLFVPLKDISPEQSSLNHVGKYVTGNTDMVSSTVFLFMVLALFVYGVVKFAVLFVLLMPMILVSFFYNYVWLDDRKSKAWVGALGILISFAGVNLGLLLLWKGLIYVMNQSQSVMNSLSVAEYPIVLAHSVVVIIYIIMAFHFVLKPLYKTVRGDLKNLGGTSLAEGALNFSGNLKSSMKNFWDGLSDPESKKGLAGTKAGSQVVSAVKAGKDAFSKTDKMKKDRGLSGKMNSDQLKQGRSEDQKESDKKAVESIDRKVNGKENGKKKGRALETEGANSLVGMLGLSKFRNGVSDGEDDRSLFDRLKEAKTAAGKAWVDEGTSWQSKKGQDNLKRAKEALGTEEFNEDVVAEMPHVPEVSEEEMKELEELGMDHSVVGKSDAREFNPVVIDAENEENVESMKKSLDDKGYKYTVEGNKVYVKLKGEDFQKASVRKDMLNGAVVDSSKNVKALMESKVVGSKNGYGAVAQKVDDKTYTFNKGEITDDMMKYIQGKNRKEGWKMEHKTLEDGSLEMKFSSKVNASKAIDDIQKKTHIEAKHKGDFDVDSFDVAEKDRRLFTDALNASGLNYQETKDDLTGMYNYSVGQEDVEQVKEMIGSSARLRRKVKEMSGESLKVESNEWMDELVEGYVEDGHLVEGEDIIFQDDSFVLMSETGKRMLSQLENDYETHKVEEATRYEDQMMKFSETIQGKGGFDTGVYVRGESGEVDELLSESDLDVESYFIQNKNLDPLEMDKLVSTLEKKQNVANKKLEDAHSALNKIQKSNAEDIPYMERIKSLEKEADKDHVRFVKKGINEYMEELSEAGMDVERLEEIQADRNMRNQEKYQEMMDEIEFFTKDTYGRAYKEYHSKKEALAKVNKEHGKALSAEEKEFISHYKEAKGKGVEFNRRTDHVLEATSLVDNQEQLVENLVKEFSEVKRLTEEKAKRAERSGGGREGREGPRKPSERGSSDRPARGSESSGTSEKSASGVDVDEAMKDKE